MSVRQLLNYVFSWAIQRVDHEKVEQWLSDLDAPYWVKRPGAAGSADRAEQEKAEFRAAMAAG